MSEIRIRLMSGYKFGIAFQASAVTKVTRRSRSGNIVKPERWQKS